MSYKIFDAHAHVYPEKIAEKAVKAIGDFYDIYIQENGTASGLIESWSENGKMIAAKCLIHSTATTAHQVERINDFISGIVSGSDKFVGFGTLHTDLTDEQAFSEVDRMIKIGLKGVKLHPDFQEFYADGENAQKIYRATRGKLPILFHAGDKRYGYSSPERIAKVARDYPDQIVIAAHFGGYSEWDKVADVYRGIENVYFDTSSSLMFLKEGEAEKMIRALGYEKFLFGTDFPMWSPKGELERFFRLDLTETEREAILGKNAERLLNIKL